MQFTTSGPPGSIHEPRGDGCRTLGSCSVRVSSKGDYACRALLSLTLHQTTPGPTSVRDIAERTGIPQPYLEQILLELKGAVVTMDAMGCQKAIARQIAEAEADYVLALKDNHPTLCEDVRLWLDTEAAKGALPVRDSRGETLPEGETLELREPLDDAEGLLLMDGVLLVVAVTL